MIALLFAVAIVLFLGLVGLGVMTLFGRRISLGILLLSPAIGMGVTLPIELSFNRAGLPVEAFGQWLVLGFAVFFGIVLAIRRPTIPWNRLLPLIPAYVAGALLAGAPLLLYGFHWAGNSNGDMSVYVSTADDFLHHGFFDVASLHELMRGTDVPRNLWFWEVAPPNRFGTDALLALVAAAAHLRTYEIYMSLSVAAFLMLIMGVGALCANPQMERRIATVTILFAVASPLMFLSVYQQILPQLLGQVCFVGIVAAVQVGGSGLLQRPIALGCCATALSLVYPEITSLFGAGIALTLPVALWQRRKDLAAYVKRLAPVAFIAGAVVLVLENVQIFTWAAAMQILESVVGRSVGGGPGAITYYMIPSGIANLWGLEPFVSYRDPWLTISIIAGAIGFLAAAIVALRCLLRYAKFSDGMLLGIQLAFVWLVIGRSGYPAFKIAFWLQVFLAPAVALMILWAADRLARILRTPPVFARAGLVTLCLAATAFSTYTYMGATSDLFMHTKAEFTEISGASRNDLYGTLDAIARRYANQIGRPIRMDALNWQLDLLAGIALRGHPLEYQGADPFLQFFGNTTVIVPEIIGWPGGLRDFVTRTAKQRARLFAQKILSLPSATNHVEFTAADDPTAVPTRNIASDSDIFSAGWSEWNPRGFNSQRVADVGPDKAHGGWESYLGNGRPVDTGVISDPISVKPGETVTASVWIDPSGTLGSFNSRIYINTADTVPTKNLISEIYHGRKPGRVSISVTIPPGITSIYLLFSTDGAILAKGQWFTWSMPMLEVGSRMTPYVPSTPFTRFYIYSKDEKVFVPPAQPFDRRDGLFLEIGPQLSLLNRSRMKAPFMVRIVPWNTVRSWLLLVESDFGTPVTLLVDQFTPAMGDVEPDPYNQPNFMATVGRSMLLEVINGPPTVRLQLALTATFNPRPYTQIPPIVIMGTSRLKIPSVGVGSARIVTPPIRPFSAFGRRYLIVYFGDRLLKFNYDRVWLMNLYGRDIDIDPRQFALFGRDISIAGPLPPAPVQIGSFPRDLMNPGLLYGGIFEDGWVGRKFSVRLHSNDEADGLRLRLTVPPASRKQIVTVKIDGRLSGRITVKPSTYVDVNLPGAPPGDHTVTVQAASTGKNVLRYDVRPVWARLQEIGFEPGGDAR